MSEHNDVIAGKLRLKSKGRALDVKSGGVTKKKKHYHKLFTGSNYSTDLAKEEDLSVNVVDGEGGNGDERLTAAEKRCLEQWQKLEMQRLEKSAAKSHRDRIQEFNRYLANSTEHYDIPKVGPG